MADQLLSDGERNLSNAVIPASGVSGVWSCARGWGIIDLNNLP
jgi:hypothetical protein